MEVALLIVLVALLARGARFLGLLDARAHRAGAGVLDGLFALSSEYSRSGGLGWPAGVQEEDRDRLWTWLTPTEAGKAVLEVGGDPTYSKVDFVDWDGAQLDAQAALIDSNVAPVPVYRVR